MKVITRAKAADIDLAVAPLSAGKSSMTLVDIARTIMGEWVRVANAGYQAGANGGNVSLLCKDGRIVEQGEGRPWPIFLVTKDGTAEIVDALGDVSRVKCAVSAGPWLVRAGRLCNISEEIARGGYTGLQPAAAVPRAAIGIAPGGIVVHLAVDAATLDEMASEMQQLGCANAISLDGGGSMGVGERGGKILIGQAARRLCCALVFRGMLPEPQESKGSTGNMIVCIDPGHGGSDPGAVGPDGTLEKHITLFAAQRVAEYLQRAGFETLLTRDADVDVDLDRRCAMANQKPATIFISVHANWMDKTENGKKQPGVPDPNTTGLEVFYYPGSARGMKLAGYVAAAMQIASGLRLSRLDTATYKVLKRTDMPAVLLELGYLSHPVDRSLLKEVSYIDKYALGIAFGVMEYFR